MGRHSIEQKRSKRRKQKKRKRLALKQTINSGVNHNAEDQRELPAIEHTGEPSSCTDNTCRPFYQCGNEDSDDDLCARLDRVGEESDDYWENTARMKIKEFESFRDKHPYIVTDKQRSFEVWVDGTGKYKGTAALKKVDIKSYFDQVVQKEAKATDLCRMLRDRIEGLENSLKDSKVKIVNMHRENQRKIEKVRYFWRNKIFEGNSRGADMLKSALMYPDMFS